MTEKDFRKLAESLGRQLQQSGLQPEPFKLTADEHVGWRWTVVASWSKDRPKISLWRPDHPVEWDLWFGFQSSSEAQIVRLIEDEKLPPRWSRWVEITDGDYVEDELRPAKIQEGRNKDGFAYEHFSRGYDDFDYFGKYVQQSSRSVGDLVAQAATYISDVI